MNLRGPSRPPDYALHEPVYRDLRRRGATGWSDDAEYVRMLQAVVPALQGAADGTTSVLEIGSGAGNLSVALASSGYAVSGIEISPTAVEWSNERANLAGVAATLRLDNAVDLSTCSDDSFDNVVDGHLLHCIVGADRARCLRSVYRVLRPGGAFVVLTMCGEVIDPRLLEHFDPASRNVFHDSRPTRHVGTAESITAEIVHAGFEIDGTTVVSRSTSLEQDDLIVRAIKPANRDVA